MIDDVDEIHVYTTTDNHEGYLVTQFLKSHGLRYQLHNLTANPWMRNYLVKQGYERLPLTVKDEVRIVGFKPDLMLKGLLNL